MYIVQYFGSPSMGWIDLEYYESLSEARDDYNYRAENHLGKFRLIKQTVEVLEVSSFVVKSCDREF